MSQIKDRLDGSPRHICLDPPVIRDEFCLVAIAFFGAALIGLLLGGVQ